MSACSIRKLDFLAMSATLLAAACSKPTEDAPTSSSGAAQRAASAAPDRSAAPLDVDLLRSRLGVAVTPGPGGAFRAFSPRNDLNVSVEGVPAPRALELGMAVEFWPATAGAEVSGSVTLLEDEVDPALDTLLSHGLDVIGLHNRFALDEPRVLVLHFAGSGDPALLASGVQSLTSATRDARLRAKTPARSWPGEPVAPGGTLDATLIGSALGAAASQQGDAVVVRVPWPEPTSARPTASEPVLHTVWVGSDAQVMVDGTFVLPRAELARALGALRRANAHVTALHPLGSERGAGHFSVYFRAKGSSVELVQALRRALEAPAPPR